MMTIFLITSAIVCTYCINKLIDASLATNQNSYSLIVERVMGKKSRFCTDVMLSLSQFSFTISKVVFFINTFKVTCDYLFSTDSNPWIYGCIVICVYSPIAWVRNLAKFSFTFMLGNMLILLAILFVTVYCCMTIAYQDGIAPDIKFIN